MSIIYDALKRVEKSASGTTADRDRLKTNPPNKPKPILVFILVILSALFAGNITYYLLMHPKRKPTPPPAPVIAIPAKPPEPLVNEEKPVAPLPAPDPTLTLSGVFFQHGKGYALINNRILEAGDKIEGATIKEISLEKVALDFEGRIITLTNSSR